jgi:hypothetical protein
LVGTALHFLVGIHRRWYVTDIGGSRRKLCLIFEGLTTAQGALDRLRVEKHD